MFLYQNRFEAVQRERLRRSNDSCEGREKYLTEARQPTVTDTRFTPYSTYASNRYILVVLIWYGPTTWIFPWNSSMISTIIKHFMCCKHTCYFWNILYIDTNGVKFQNQTGNCFCGNTNVDQRFWKKFALTLKLILSSVNPTNIRKGKLCLFVLVSSLACIFLWWSDYMMIAERETLEKVIGRLVIGGPWTALVDITH